MLAGVGGAGRGAGVGAVIRLLCGDMRALLAEMPEAHFHACATDPPYHLPGGFMSADWDKGDRVGVAFQPETWRAVYRVLRPGAFLLAFGGTRTSHRMACAIEDAGFEIRDSLQWIYSTGFPKSLDVSKAIDRELGAEREVIGVNSNVRPNHRGVKKHTPNVHRYTANDAVTAVATEEAMRWEGFGTALKPAHEPILCARKPLAERNIAANVLAYECGGLNIGACRIQRADNDVPGWHESGANGTKGYLGTDTFRMRDVPAEEIQARCGGAGRWPPNAVFTHSPDCTEARCGLACPVAEIGRQGGESVSPAKVGRGGEYFGGGTSRELRDYAGPADSGDASRFFPVFWPDAPEFPFRYVPKPCRAERDAGIATTGTRHRVNPGGLEHDPRWAPVEARNTHATVKPVGLLRWLTRLVTPPGGEVLDPFCGSGTTGMACALEGFGFTGCDLSAEYVEIARQRIEWCRTALRSRPRGKRANPQATLDLEDL